MTSGLVVHNRSLQLEVLVVKCRPFYLPREFTAIIVMYIPPNANANKTSCELYGTITSQQTAYPNGFFIVTRDVNHVYFSIYLNRLYCLYMNFATRRVNILDLVHTNIHEANKAIPGPHHGYLDHLVCCSKHTDHC